MPQKWIWDQFLSQTEHSIIIIITFVSSILVHKALSYPLSGYESYAAIVLSMMLLLQLSRNVRKTLGNLGSVFCRSKKRNLIRWPWDEWQDQFLCNYFNGILPFIALKWIDSASWLNDRRGNLRDNNFIKFISGPSDSECVSWFRTFFSQADSFSCP